MSRQPAKRPELEIDIDEAEQLLALDQVALEKVKMKDADSQEPGSPTLLEWFQMTRTVKSCPASECGQSRDFSDVDNSVTETRAPSSTELLGCTPDHSPMAQKTKLSSQAAPFQPTTARWVAVPVRCVRPAQTQWFVPNAGSTGHAWGDCAPCAFFHTTGCVKGQSCSYCHLCGP
ncbi:unnamed protein product [Cladocopium goreaui]|uniref:C3H1-type domain-containing protein n=1 Tax=Cladocopium goreaui TaxID=2562237 RepID=A0A9P1GNJ9_9DINO|nr:unnamed protein product [Cladocopium goreaui]